jgi:hypothetical protein
MDKRHARSVQSCAVTRALSLVTELCRLVDDAPDFAAVDVEVAGDGALTLTCLAPGKDRLLQGSRGRKFQWRVLFQLRCGQVPKFGLGVTCPCATPGADQHHQEFE